LLFSNHAQEAAFASEALPALPAAIFLAQKMGAGVGGSEVLF
jgi:hypothetical protein